MCGCVCVCVCVCMRMSMSMNVNMTHLFRFYSYAPYCICVYVGVYVGVYVHNIILYVAAPDQIQSNRRHDGNNSNFDISFNSHSSAKMNKSSKFSSSMTTTTSTYRDSASASAVGSPRMNTSVSRNVKGQVVVPVKSPTRISSSGLHSTSQLSSSMKKVGSAQNQNSFTNDSTRYMDQTKSRKAAWGPSTTSISYNQLSSTLAASSLLESTKKSASASIPQTKTIYGSSSKWLMEFRYNIY
jgi:hypothetical protein